MTAVTFQEPTPLRVSGRRLHVGGRDVRAGWEIFNIQPADGVDHVGDCTDLSRFDDGTFVDIYASHVIEHLGYQTELPRALREVRRVLAKGGVLRVSVPNLTLICKMFLHPDLDVGDQFRIMRLAFGGQMDAFDFHKVGFSWAILRQFLREAGFDPVVRVKEHGLFDDTSSVRVSGNFISLNAEAFAP